MVLWSYSVLRFGHLVKNMWLSGFYLFCCSLSALWTHRTSMVVLVFFNHMIKKPFLDAHFVYRGNAFVLCKIFILFNKIRQPRVRSICFPTTRKTAYAGCVVMWLGYEYFFWVLKIDIFLIILCKVITMDLVITDGRCYVYNPNLNYFQISILI